MSNAFIQRVGKTKANENKTEHISQAHCIIIMGPAINNYVGLVDFLVPLAPFSILAIKT